MNGIAQSITEIRVTISKMARIGVKGVIKDILVKIDGG